MTPDPDIPAVLARHAARRAAGVATVTAFVGAIGPARRAWVAHAGTVVECTGEPSELAKDDPGPLFAAVSSVEALDHWGTFAEQHRSLPVAVVANEGVWKQFVSKFSNTRAEATVREGELRVPNLKAKDVEKKLVAGGLSAKAAKALAQTASDGAFVDEVIALFKDTAAKPTSKAADDKARSAAEKYIYARLEDLAETAGRFKLNPNMPFKFGKMAAKPDLVCDDPKVAIEVDGYYHFRSDDDYRHDREKDWELQRHGYIVLRFLAEDVTSRWDVVRDRIFAALKRVGA